MQPVNWSSPINWNHPLNRGLVGWWMVVPHWTGGTIWRDLTGLRHGVLTLMDPIADWAGPGDRTGSWGGLDFDGSDDSVSISETTKILASLTNSTVIARVNFSDSTGPANGGTIYSERSEATSIWKVMVSQSANTLDFVHRDSAGNLTFVTGAISITQRDVTVAMTKNGTSVQLYIDGVADGTPSTLNGNDTLTVSQVWIGQDAADSGSIFTGPIDFVRIYDRTLSAVEITKVTQYSKQFWPGLLNRRGRREVVVVAGGDPEGSLVGGKLIRGGILTHGRLVA